MLAGSCLSLPQQAGWKTKTSGDCTVFQRMFTCMLFQKFNVCDIFVKGAYDYQTKAGQNGH